MSEFIIKRGDLPGEFMSNMEIGVLYRVEQADIFKEVLVSYTEKFIIEKAIEAGRISCCCGCKEFWLND